MVQSPRDVPTYDHKPEMSAPEVARVFSEGIASGSYGFGLVNFANADMVGHSGVIPAVIDAVETVDRCLGQVLEAVQAAGGVCLVTADHGNAERMLQPDGSPHTAHTTNPVPVVLVGGRDLALRGRRLSDVPADPAPAAGIDPTAAMAGCRSSCPHLYAVYSHPRFL